MVIFTIHIFERKMLDYNDKHIWPIICLIGYKGRSEEWMNRRTTIIMNGKSILEQNFFRQDKTRMPWKTWRDSFLLPRTISPREMSAASRTSTLATSPPSWRSRCRWSASRGSTGRTIHTWTSSTRLAIGMIQSNTEKILQASFSPTFSLKH